MLPRVNSDTYRGDFVNKQTESDLFKGISVVLLNTDKGSELFKGCKDAFQCKEYMLKDVIPGNQRY